MGAYYFPNIFSKQASTFLENNKTRVNKIISLQQNKTKQSTKANTFISHKQYKSSLTTVSKTTLELK